MGEVLALYAEGVTTGICLNIGGDGTNAVPVYEGYCLPHAVMKLDLAGKDVTDYLEKHLSLKGITMRRHLIDDLKEKVCSISPDITKEGKSSGKTFTLPTGETLDIGELSYLGPEVLFNPSMTSKEMYYNVPEAIYKSVFKCDPPIRQDMLREIVISGGSSLFPGVEDRILNELKGYNSEMRYKIRPSVNRQYLSWRGGSMLVDLDTFQPMVIKPIGTTTCSSFLIASS